MLARIVRCAASSSTPAAVAAPEPASFVKPGSQLEQLAAMTVLSIDTGDIQTIQKFAATGFIADATTNPLFGEPDSAVDAVALCCSHTSASRAVVPCCTQPFLAKVGRLCDCSCPVANRLQLL
jgi:hypothetical protein